MKMYFSGLIMLAILLSNISCKDNSIDSTAEVVSIYELTLSGWNGKMGREDNIVRLNNDGIFTKSVISQPDSCGKLSEQDFEIIISQLTSIDPMEITLYHELSCSDAQGGMQTTKLTIRDVEKNITNTIRWSDCENDSSNKLLMKKLDSLRDIINNAIAKTEKGLCEL